MLTGKWKFLESYAIEGDSPVHATS
jgi:hypothetical protein